MSLFLQIVIAVVLVAIAACLVPLLLQMRRTARAVETLADSARLDLNGIAADVHQVRARVDQMADLAAEGLAIPASLGDWVTRLARGLPSALEGKTPVWLSMAMAGFNLILKCFRRPKEKSHE